MLLRKLFINQTLQLLQYLHPHISEIIRDVPEVKQWA